MRDWTRKDKIEFALSMSMLIVFVAMLYVAMWIVY
jgi:hypothetical protein